jgi:hypothetical protein
MLALVAGVVYGCAADAGGPGGSGRAGGETDDGKADQPTGNGALYATRNENVEILHGLHTLFDRTAGRCVQGDGANAAEVRVGNTTSMFEAVHISSREELARELGIDLGLKVRYGISSGNASLNMVNNFTRSSRSAHLLLKTTFEYSVTNRSALSLTEEASGLLADGDVNRFVSRCGTHYANGARYGAQLFILLRFSAQNESTATDLNASLGIRVQTGVTSVRGDLRARLSTASQREGVSVSVTVVPRGFDTAAGAEAAPSFVSLVSNGFNDATFGVIEQIWQAMQRSVSRDMCRDAGEGQCDGVAAPGYFRNPRRWSEPLGVALGFYDGVGNVPAGSGAQFATVRDNIRLVERYVRAFSEMKERMEMAHNDEVDVFLRAPDSLKAGFNVAVPGEARWTVEDLVRTANVWRQNFYPADRGNPVGWDVERMGDRISECWNRAASNVMETCGTFEEAGDFDHGLAQLEKYRDEARILELRYTIAPALMSYQAAVDHCGEQGWRLPTVAEAGLVAPLVGFGPLPATTETPHEAWLLWNGRPCEADGASHVELFNSPADPAAGGTYCAGPERQMAVICVPPTGPMPLLPDP